MTAYAANGLVSVPSNEVRFVTPAAQPSPTPTATLNPTPTTTPTPTPTATPPKATTIVRGNNNSTGIALFEAYNLP